MEFKSAIEQDNKPIFKLIVIGASAVGKSSFLRQYIHKDFKEQYDVTIGVEFISKQVYLGSDKPDIQLQIWDTAGQESFKSIVKQFYRNASAVLLLYDITNSNSFMQLDTWLKEVRENAHNEIVIGVVGNQLDKQNEREVTYEAGENWKKLRGANIFMETSAKEGINVDKIFTEISQIIYDKYMNNNQFKSQIEGQNPNVIQRNTHNQTFKLKSSIIQSSSTEYNSQLTNQQSQINQQSEIGQNDQNNKKKKKGDGCC